MLPLRNSLLVLSSLLLLSNCAPTPKTISVPVVVQTKVEIKPRPRPLNLTEPTFHVVTKDNLDIFLKGMYTNGEYVFVAMSVPDYEKLSLSVSDIERYLKQQEALITYYEHANN